MHIRIKDEIALFRLFSYGCTQRLATTIRNGFININICNKTTYRIIKSREGVVRVYCKEHYEEFIKNKRLSKENK